jgi:hypothetical protein
MDLDAPGTGRFEVWGELDGKLYRYCSSLEEAREMQPCWSGSTPTTAGTPDRRSTESVPTTATAAALAVVIQRPARFPQNSTCDAYPSCAEPPGRQLQG